MNKRFLHYLWTRVRPIKTWYLLAAFLVLLGIHAAALRGNYVQMTKLRAAVYEADKANGNVEQALQELRAFVSGHMNTDLDVGNGVYPPVQLKYTYERLVKAEQDRVNAVNSQIYTDAQKHCEIQDPTSVLGRSRLPCVEQYIKSHPGTTARAIPDALYKFDFASPPWSPDLAGWTRVLAVVFLLFAIIRFALGRWLHTAAR
jgi:hypothetical protein